MVKKLTRHGNSLALVIDKPILELLKITAETPLEISTDGRTLIIAPSRQGDRRSTLNYFLTTSGAKYGQLLKELNG